MNTVDVSKRLEMLVSGCLSTEFLKEEYGVKISDQFNARYYSWAKRFDKKSDSRFTFIRFLNRNSFIPKKHSMSCLGMDEPSFDSFVSQVVDRNIFTKNEIEPIDSIFNRNIIDKIGTHLFKDELDVEELHGQLNKELGIEIVPLRSVYPLHGSPWHDIADSFDIITGEPINSVFAVYLDFNGPLDIKQDSCSVATFIKWYDLLYPYVKDYEMKRLKERFNDDIPVLMEMYKSYSFGNEDYSI